MFLFKVVTRGTFVGFFYHFRITLPPQLVAPRAFFFNLHPSCAHRLLLPPFAWSPHQLQSAPFVCFLSSSSFISNFCFCFLLSFPLAEIFHFWFATRGFLRAFFLLHFCGSSLPSSLPIFALVFCWVFVVMHVFFLTNSYFIII